VNGHPDCQRADPSFIIVLRAPRFRVEGSKKYDGTGVGSRPQFASYGQLLCLLRTPGTVLMPYTLRSRHTPGTRFRKTCSITPPTGVDNASLAGRGFAKDKHPTEATAAPRSGRPGAAFHGALVRRLFSGPRVSTPRRPSARASIGRSAFCIPDARERRNRSGRRDAFVLDDRAHRGSSAEAIRRTRLVAHRMAILRRGSLGRLRSPYQFVLFASISRSPLAVATC